MTRAEGRRLYGRDSRGTEEGGPDPTEDPILYLEERREEEREG
jgi:hypothetical protein